MKVGGKRRVMPAPCPAARGSPQDSGNAELTFGVGLREVK
jgi:hypothetical protein